jgi:hypothetical protein
MRENRTYGSEGGGTETNRFSLPLSGKLFPAARLSRDAADFASHVLCGRNRPVFRLERTMESSLPEE